MKKALLCVSIIVFFISTSLQAQSSISRIEPPNWWIGMKHAELQLLVYGKDIGHLKASIDYPGVTLRQTHRVKNDNYLFLDFFIDKTAKPGTMQITFAEKGRTLLTKDYQLLQREKDPLEVVGFDASDVLYLITPDRFANGKPENDAVTGMLEKPDRQNKDGRHGGDIEGIRQSLDYLKDMGFTAIWLNPVMENDMPEYSYHGYAATDFYKVDTRFGSNESYRQLSNEAKSKGIKLIMDMIVNHCGSKHWWMDDLPTDDWLNSTGDYVQTSHRKTLLQDPHASNADKKVFTDGWFVPTMPDLNQRNPMMANYLTQLSIWWIEYANLNGIRMDTYPYPDMDYMTEWTRQVMLEYPNFNIVGEEWFEEQPTIVSYWQKGKINPNGYTSELRSVMDFPIRYATQKALTEDETWGTGWIDLYEMLALDFLYPDPYELVIFPDNHDMSRIFTQVNEDYDLYKLAIAFYVTTRGVPQIYYGTEILMKNPGTGDHGIIRSDFPGGWPGDAVNAFTGKGLTDQQKDAQQYMRKLLNWRKTNTVIHKGKLTHFLPENGVYVYFRHHEGKKVMVVLNKNKEAYTLKLDRFEEMIGDAKKGLDIVSGERITIHGSFELKPMAPMIIELK